MTPHRPNLTRICRYMARADKVLWPEDQDRCREHMPQQSDLGFHVSELAVTD